MDRTPRTLLRSSTELQTKQEQIQTLVETPPLIAGSTLLQELEERLAIREKVREKFRMWIADQYW